MHRMYTILPVIGTSMAQCILCRQLQCGLSVLYASLVPRPNFVVCASSKNRVGTPSLGKLGPNYKAYILASYCTNQVAV